MSLLSGSYVRCQCLRYFVHQGTPQAQYTQNFHTKLLILQKIFVNCNADNFPKKVPICTLLDIRKLSQFVHYIRQLSLFVHYIQQLSLFNLDVHPIFMITLPTLDSIM